MNWFKRRREELGLTQWDIAIAVGTRAAAPGQWERAESCPRLKLVPKLAGVFRVTEEEIISQIVRLDKAVRQARKAKDAAPAH